ncbi:radial spoke head protein 6 homolog A [Prorops nasuta]|uniref:radial spoke head protein 6 homolog A n=1 Tax=Prorops nasuta TaxID=863751 RepID=UPI0034CDC1E7
MAYSYDIDEIPTADAPTVDHDVLRAKLFLQKHSSESGDNLYDHLAELLSKILSERPSNAIDIFEEYSKKLKAERYKSEPTYIREVYVPHVQYEHATKIIKLFQSANKVEEDVKENVEREEEDVKKSKPNMMDLLYYLEQTDIGLPRSEMVLLNLSIRKFMTSFPVENVRFWGKIFGNPKSYYVIEAELTPDELERRIEEVAGEEDKEKSEEVIKEAKVTEERVVEITEMDAEETKKALELKFPPFPVNTWRPPPEIPPESIGTGANKKVYYVCNMPGIDEWIELPQVIPQQIIVARQIIRSFTGNLDSKIHSYPLFPGTERNYLRAQIARISAATQVSPIGFYTFGGLDEEEEIAEDFPQTDELTENANYDPLPVRELLDFSNWCHHAPYLLKQGRVIWWDPHLDEDAEIDEELSEEEEEEEEEGAGEKIKETGPSLLSPLSEDSVQDSTLVPWTTRLSSNFQLDTAIAFIRSNIWPGAFAFTTNRKCANVYIGWGKKSITFNYSPPPMHPIEEQYKIGPEILEMQDPTVQDEENWRAANLPPAKTESEDEEEDEEDDDDDDEDD